MVKVYDNMLDTQMLNYVDNYIKHLPYYPHSSTTLDQRNFFGTQDLIDDHDLFDYLTDVFTEVYGKKLFKQPPKVTRVYANCHNYGKHNGGRWHTDEGDAYGNGWCNVTMLFYPQKWNTQYKGGTIFNINGEERTIEYIRNRMVVFPANIPHKAEYHTNKNDMRFTLAYKMSGMLND